MPSSAPSNIARFAPSAEQYPFTRAAADELDHDDRAELVAGIRLILAEIAALPSG